MTMPRMVTPIHATARAIRNRSPVVVRSRFSCTKAGAEGDHMTSAMTNASTGRRNNRMSTGLRRQPVHEDGGPHVGGGGLAVNEGDRESQLQDRGRAHRVGGAGEGEGVEAADPVGP